MNMKKIMASVAASALAVSAMATAAFAADDIVATATAKTTYTSAVLTFKTVDFAAGLTAGNTITIESDAPVVGDATAAMKVNGIAATKDTALTAEAAAVIADPAKLYEGTKSATVTITYTFAETADTKAYTDALDAIVKSDSTTTLTLDVNGTDVTLNGKEASYELKAVEASTEKNSVSDVKLSDLNDGKGLSVSQKAALKANAGSTVVFELKKAAEADTKFIVAIKTADEVLINKAEVTVAKGETTGTATFTAADTYDPEFEVAAGKAYVQDTNWTNTTLIKSITWTIAADSEEDPADTDVSDEEGEDTDASLDEGEDTAAEGEDTAAEGEDTAAEGSDSKGENPGTGVALAIVPAIVAGAAVVASRKRK